MSAERPQLQVASFIETKIKLHESALDNKTARAIESSAYEIIRKAIYGMELPTSFSISANNGEVTAIVQNSFAENNSDFATAFVRAGEKADLTYQNLTSSYITAGFNDLAQFQGLSIPCVFLQVDDVTAAAKDLGVDAKTLKEGLDETSYWKASEMLVFGSITDSGHDFPSYVKQAAQDLGIPYETFLEGMIAHEKAHLLADHLTDTRFHVFHTWFNEGFCDIAAGASNKPIRDLRKMRLDYKELIMQDILDGATTTHLYAGGWLLLNSIGFIFGDGDVKVGVQTFSKELFDEIDSKEGLNEKTVRLLKESGKYDKVMQRLQEQYAQF